MEKKETPLNIGLGLYLVFSLAAGILVGRGFYNVFHESGEDLSWLLAILAIGFGWFLTIILVVPVIRYTLPRCPECVSGRLKSTEEVLDIIIQVGRTDEHGQLRPEREILKKRITWYCDRCGYLNRRVYEDPLSES